MAVNEEKVAEHIRGILEAIGEDPNREGLIDTPQRVARMYSEIFCGTQYSNDEIAEKFNKTFTCESENRDMVIVRDIDAFSFCEHHMALMYDMKITVAYLPRERVIGLSKIARVADLVSRRLQLQERIGQDIAYIIEKITGSPDVAVRITASHSCMTCRGIQKTGASTVTETLRGEFLTDPDLVKRLEMGALR